MGYSLFFAFHFTFVKECAIISFKLVFFRPEAPRPGSGKRGEPNIRGGFCYEQDHHSENHQPALNLYDTQRAIGTVKRLFADTLCATPNLYRVSAPLFLEVAPARTTI